MKLGLVLSVLGIFYYSAEAQAHSSHHKGPVVQVTLGWDWIGGHWEQGKWIKGHWRHPYYGKSYKKLKHGSPVVKPSAHAYWVPGHWAGRGPNKRWISGHWR